MCQKCEIETPEQIIPQIAHGFGGGVGNSGAICGAVVGAVMAIGLKRGRADTMEEMLRETRLPRELRRRFETEMGNINCRELTGLDLTTMEGIEQFMSSETPKKVCVPAVSIAYQLAVELLAETPEPGAANDKPARG